MSSEDHYRKLENMYTQAPVNKLYMPKMTVSEGKARIEMDVDPKFFHAAKALHGAVYFKMLDDSAFFSAQSLVTDTFVLTVNFNLHFFKPVTEGKLIAEGYLRFSSTNLFVADAILSLENGGEVARGTGTFMKSHKALSADIGYSSNS